MDTQTPGSGRPTWLEIDLEAVVHNFNLARKKAGGQSRVGTQGSAGNGVEVFPVVKADGYGLGAVPIARALQQIGAPGFCVALIKEAEALRGGGITGPIRLLSGFSPGEESRVVDLGLEPFLYDLAAARRLSQHAPQERPVAVHLKVDTGMGRLGFGVEEVAEVLAELTRLPGIRVVGIASHLACADEPQRPETAAQTDRFSGLLQQPEIARLQLTASLANSAAILAHPETHFDWLRPGIMLYGGSPFFPDTRETGLKPVVTWLSRILQVKELPSGTAIGYGHTFTTSRPTRLAQIPVGYADGYPRFLSNRGMMTLHGCRAPVVGRVCMDLITLDITDIPQARVGDRVTLMGGSEAGAISLEEMSSWQQTIPYEVICRLGKRLPRHYLGGDWT
ncbi:MAG: alanine racemase [Magnetococcales bacterium]|nr:alanine racemase [Magnetococcales bacterium]